MEHIDFLIGVAIVDGLLLACCMGIWLGEKLFS